MLDSIQKGHTEPGPEVNIQDYLNKTYPCSCGRSHRISISQIIIEEDAIKHLPKLLYQASVNKPFFLFDFTTYNIAGTLVEDILTEHQIPYSQYILTEEEPIPDERTLGEVFIHFDSSCDILVAVGSGTLNDTCRFISYKLKLPYMIVATAPSMDGFASNVAPLIVNHMKTTYEAHTPFAILGDINILKKAPMEMIAAGVGDILGKYTCLCDWKIAHLLLGEYHCSFIEGIVRQSIETVINNISLVRSRDSKAIKSIMEALVLSGIAMSYAGNSRPASGSEHHLSHYWEMMFLFRGKKPVLHGTKVGIATIAVLKAFELLKDRKIDFYKAKEKTTHYSFDLWESHMMKTYGMAAPSVIFLEQSVGKNSSVNVLSRLNIIKEQWTNLKEVMALLPSSDSIRQVLSSLAAPADPMSVGIDKTTFINSFLVAKELRNRYGLLQLLFDLGLGEELAEEVWNYFYRDPATLYH